MTEIPEHLLKRSRERREAAGLPTEGGAAGGASTSSPAPVAATPAKAAAAPAPAAPKAAAPKPKPVPPYIQAAQARRKMPFWAMGALSLVPVWGFLYVRGLTPEEKVVEGPMGIGAEVYATCSTCHGAAGGGGAGRQLNNGEVLLTFPNIEDQLNMVYTGSLAYETAGFAIYGNPDRPGGAHEPGWGKGAYMPAQGAGYGGALTEVQILGVVCHERYEIGGADPTAEYAEEYAKWCAPEAEMFLALEEGETFDAIEGVGTEPRAAIENAAG